MHNRCIVISMQLSAIFEIYTDSPLCGKMSDSTVFFFKFHKLKPTFIATQIIELTKDCSLMSSMTHDHHITIWFVCKYFVNNFMHFEFFVLF